MYGGFFKERKPRNGVKHTKESLYDLSINDHKKLIEIINGSDEIPLYLKYQITTVQKFSMFAEVLRKRQLIFSIVREVEVINDHQMFDNDFTITSRHIIMPAKRA